MGGRPGASCRGRVGAAGSGGGCGPSPGLSHAGPSRGFWGTSTQGPGWSTVSWLMCVGSRGRGGPWMQTYDQFPRGFADMPLRRGLRPWDSRGHWGACSGAGAPAASLGFASGPCVGLAEGRSRQRWGSGEILEHTAPSWGRLGCPRGLGVAMGPLHCVARAGGLCCAHIQCRPLSNLEVEKDKGLPRGRSRRQGPAYSHQDKKFASYLLRGPELLPLKSPRGLGLSTATPGDPGPPPHLLILLGSLPAPSLGKPPGPTLPAC